MPRTITLAECFLVPFSVSLQDTIRYNSTELDKQVDGVREVKKMETIRTIEDVQRHAGGVSLRSAMYRRLETVCKKTIIGYICPMAKLDDLNAALLWVREQAATYNDGDIGRIVVDEAIVEIRSDNESAARAIAKQLQSIMDDLMRALDKADVKALREVIETGMGLEAMLPPEDGAAFVEAMRAARTAARTIQREVVKKKQDYDTIKSEIDTRPIEAARARFLDFDTSPVLAKLPEPSEPTAASDRAAGLDLGGDTFFDPEEQPSIPSPVVSLTSLDF